MAAMLPIWRGHIRLNVINERARPVPLRGRGLRGVIQFKTFGPYADMLDGFIPWDPRGSDEGVARAVEDASE